MVEHKDSMDNRSGQCIVKKRFSSKWYVLSSTLDARRFQTRSAGSRRGKKLETAQLEADLQPINNQMARTREREDWIYVMHPWHLRLNDV